MPKDFIYAVKSNPRYHELVARRSALCRPLSIINLLIYLVFILIIAGVQPLLAQPPYGDSYIAIGVVSAIGAMISAMILAGIYIFFANTVFDRLNHQIRLDAL